MPNPRHETTLLASQGSRGSGQAIFHLVVNILVLRAAQESIMRSRPRVEHPSLGKLKGLAVCGGNCMRSWHLLARQIETSANALGSLQVVDLAPRS